MPQLLQISLFLIFTGAHLISAGVRAADTALGIVSPLPTLSPSR